MPKKVPFIPKMSIEYKPMKHYYCETDTTATLVSRAEFLRLLHEQPCPMGQTYVDFEAGCAYLFPYDPARAERFSALNRTGETEYKRFQRTLAKSDGVTEIHFHDVNELIITALISTDTPETQYLARERGIEHREAFSSLPASDREILAAYLEAGCNARELARRLGKNPSGVIQRLKRAAERLEKSIVKN